MHLEVDEYSVLLTMTFLIGCSFGALCAVAIMKYEDKKQNSGAALEHTTRTTSEIAPVHETIVVGQTKRCEKYHSMARPCKVLIDLRSRAAVKEFTPCALCWKTQ